MEHPEEHYYKLNRFLLTACGLWPYQSTKDARMIRAFFTVLMVSSLFVQLMSILTSEITMDYIFDVIPTFLPVLGGLIHLHLHAIYTDKLKEIFDRIWNDWTLQKTDNEMKIMHEYAGNSRICTIYITFYFNISVLIYGVFLYMPDILDVVSPINGSRLRKQYFQLEYFVLEEQYISLIRLHIWIVILFLSIIVMTSLSLFVAVMQHVCGMCELLGYRAERLFCVDKNTAGRDLRCRAKLIHKNTAVFIQLHNNVIQLIGVVDHFHSVLFLSDLLGIIIVLSITLMQVISIGGNVEQAVRSLTISCAQVMYLVLTNYLGQQLIDKSSSIHNRVYNSAWYDAIAAQQKPLLLIMRRRFQPFAVTACKFYVLSLPNLGRILQTAVSYCMFIRQSSL